MDTAQARAAAEAWIAHDPDPATVSELKGLLESGPESELVDRFAATLEFGTAGLRGVLGAGPNRMNRAVVRRTTAGLARYLKAQVPDAAARGVVVGRDSRRMSRELAEDAAAVLAAEGIPALYFPNVVPTPVTAFATLQLGAAAAVMVTASHNPPEYNGYKVYWGNGAQIIPPHDQGIARAISAVEPADQVRLAPAQKARAQGLWRDVGDEIGKDYLEAILALRLQTRKPTPLRIVYTAMHGVGGAWAVAALERAGFVVHPVPEQQEPDGAFPTVRFPNPEEPGALDLSLALAEKTGADLALANDPDADRLAAVVRDERGGLRQLTGNEVGVLLGHYLLTQSPPTQKPLVITTIVSSAQLKHMAGELGALYDETLTGFKWIANRALVRERAEGARFIFGYEEALGYTVGTVARDKDGIGTAVVFADMAAWCAGRGTTVWGYLEEIQRQFGLYAASQKSFTFPGAQGAAAIGRVMDAFRAHPPAAIGGRSVVARTDYLGGHAGLPSANVIAYELEGGGRVTLRPSGTEPKVKYYFELRERLAPSESPAAARGRAQSNLSELEAAFVALTRL